jgi:hypothetical protein
VFVKIVNDFFLVFGVVASDSWCLSGVYPLHCVVAVVVVKLGMEPGGSQRDVDWHDENEV